MGKEQSGQHSPARLDSGAASRPARLDQQTIFRELIAQELRAGRLNRAGRKRIVQYAAHHGLTAVESGDLISQCRDAALQSTDAQERAFAQRLARTSDDNGSAALQTLIMVAVAVVAASMIHLLL
jgi:hypothetical protein